MPLKPLCRIRNHYELQKIMFSILAKLTIVEFKNFGQSCFETLKEMMSSGAEMEQAIQDVVKKNIINKFT